MHDAECARVAAAASEAGRPRISAANAADWEQPQLEARGADGECLYLIEERQYYGLRRQLGSYRNTNGFLLEHYLTHEQFCALPPSEQVLCRGYECKHKSQYPKCRRHCRCDGYELRDITRQVPDGRKVVLRTEIKYDCLWRKLTLVQKDVTAFRPLARGSALLSPGAMHVPSMLCRHVRAFSDYATPSFA